MLGIELKPMFRQLGLRILAGTAKFAVNGCLHDDLGCILVGGHRDFEDHIAVCRIHTRYLQKMHSPHGKPEALARFAARRGHKFVLRPTENSINANFLRGNIGNGNVFLQVAEISNARLDRQAFTEVLGIRLKNTIVGTITGGTKQREQYDAAN
jgi:hypothetical protein